MRTPSELFADTPTNIILNHELDEIRLLLQNHAGVLIDGSAEMLGAGVESYLTAHGFSSASDFIADVRKSPAKCESLLEVLLPGDTAFFRPAGLFEQFQGELLSHMLLRGDEETLRPLRIWSAGCSTGEEAYSIGICVCEALAQNHRSWNVHIVAGDIRQGALSVAERGLYPASAVLHLPTRFVPDYFSRVGDHVLVTPRLRNLVSFAHMNLVEPAFIGRFHCIFCLDVLAHLSVAGKAVLWHRLQLGLEPGGYLFLSEHDQVPASFPFLRHSAGIYQRPFAAAANAGK